MKSLNEYLNINEVKNIVSIDINNLDELKKASIDDICLSIFPLDKHKQLWADAKSKNR